MAQQVPTNPEASPEQEEQDALVFDLDTERGGKIFEDPLSASTEGHGMASISAARASEVTSTGLDLPPIHTASESTQPRHLGRKAAVATVVASLLTGVGFALGSRGSSVQPSVTSRPPAAAAPNPGFDASTGNGSQPVESPEAAKDPSLVDSLPPSQINPYFKDADHYVGNWQEEAAMLSLYDKPVGVEKDPVSFTRAVVADWEAKLAEARAAALNGQNKAFRAQTVDGLVLLIQDSATGQVDEVSQFIAYGKHSKNGSYALDATPISPNPHEMPEDLVLVYLDSAKKWQAIAVLEDGSMGWHTGSPKTTRVAGALVDRGRSGEPTIHDTNIDKSSLSTTSPGVRLNNRIEDSLRTAFRIDPAKPHADLQSAAKSALSKQFREPRSTTGLADLLIRE
jgi:hypothetical protein